MDRKKLRLKLIGNKHFQWNTILFFLSTVMLTGLSVLITNVMIILKSANFNHGMQEMARWAVINKIILWSMGTIGLCIFFAALIALIYSNKIAGPLHRLKLYLHEMMNGNLEKPLKFRHDDEFKDLSLAVNSFREKLICIKESKDT